MSVFADYGGSIVAKKKKRQAVVQVIMWKKEIKSSQALTDNGPHSCHRNTALLTLNSKPPERRHMPYRMCLCRVFYTFIY